MGTSYAVAVFSAMAIVCQAFTTPTITETRTTRKDQDQKLSTTVVQPTTTSQLLTTLLSGYSTTVDGVSTVTEIGEVSTSTVATTLRSETSTTVRTTETVLSTTPAPVVPERSYPARTPSRLDERLEALDCDIPLLPAESRLWRGNETHELMLPITVS